MTVAATTLAVLAVAAGSAVAATSGVRNAVTAPPVAGHLNGFTFTPMLDGPLAARELASQVGVDGDLFVWGGRQGQRHPGSATPDREAAPVADGAVYDPSTGSWTRVSASPLSARYSAPAVVTDAGVLVAGGRAATPLPDGALYDV